ncbi:hypothetical protein PENTCL1PPCAC_19446, partial [Pristionchus entomophagus]
ELRPLLQSALECRLCRQIDVPSPTQLIGSSQCSLAPAYYKECTRRPAEHPYQSSECTPSDYSSLKFALVLLTRIFGQSSGAICYCQISRDTRAINRII